MKTLTIIETGRPPATIEGDWPDYPEMFEDLIGPFLPDWSFASVALSSGAPLPDPSQLDAILITGSPAGVYDEEPWMAPLMEFIARPPRPRSRKLGSVSGITPSPMLWARTWQSPTKGGPLGATPMKWSHRKAGWANRRRPCSVSG